MHTSRHDGPLPNYTGSQEALRYPTAGKCQLSSVSTRRVFGIIPVRLIVYPYTQDIKFLTSKSEWGFQHLYEVKTRKAKSRTALIL